MTITITELKENLSKYLLLSLKEDIYITKNGKIISKLTNPFQDKIKIVEELIGSIPSDITLEEAKEERIKEI